MATFIQQLFRVMKAWKWAAIKERFIKPSKDYWEKKTSFQAHTDTDLLEHLQFIFVFL